MTLRNQITGAVIAFMAAAPAAAQGVSVSDIRVGADLTAVTSPEAAQYWGNLESDLMTALAAEFVGQTSPDGLIVAIDVDEISMANFFTAGSGVDDARLTGDVGLINPDNEKVERLFSVSASANQAASYLPAGTDVITISPTSKEFYDAVVRAFASGVADTVRTGG
jgi:hypothetical protein